MNIASAPIVWNDSLQTGVEVIDEQHRILVNMLNDAHERLTDTSSRDLLESIVRDLISYALYHFDTEEELMLETAYEAAARDAHFNEHRAFSEKVAGVQQSLSQGKGVSRDELLGFLNNWLINHIMQTDMRLAAHINSTT
jgi:hemerythrin